jgi:hypothetical protein
MELVVLVVSKMEITALSGQLITQLKPPRVVQTGNRQQLLQLQLQALKEAVRMGVQPQVDRVLLISTMKISFVMNTTMVNSPHVRDTRHGRLLWELPTPTE